MKDFDKSLTGISVPLFPKPLVQEGQTWEHLGAKIGYIDKTGKLVIAPQFDYGHNFSEGLAAVQVRNKWGYIDKNGNIVIKPQFDLALEFSEGLAAVRFGAYTSKWGYINNAGKLAINLNYKCSWGNIFSHGLASVHISSKDGKWKWGYIDTTGKMVIPVQFDSTDKFSAGLAWVSMGPLGQGKDGYIDKDGKYIFSQESKAIESSIGSVITLDGTHILSIFNPNYNSTSSNYLNQAIDANWTNRIKNNIGPITQFGWSGNIYETDTYVQYLSALLEKRTKENSRNKAKLVVLAHSWGTVLSYLAISKNKNIVVDKLVTLGSPLNAQNSNVNSFTKKTIGRKLAPLSNVKDWQNYWADCDPISGKISVANNNFIVAPKTIDNILSTCHMGYFEDFGVWQEILLDVLLAPTPK